MYCCALIYLHFLTGVKHGHLDSLTHSLARVLTHSLASRVGGCAIARLPALVHLLEALDVLPAIVVVPAPLTKQPQSSTRNNNQQQHSRKRAHHDKRPGQLHITRRPHAILCQPTNQPCAKPTDRHTNACGCLLHTNARTHTHINLSLIHI